MKKTKFTIIDFFIVVAVIAVLGAGVYFLMPNSIDKEDASSVKFTVLATAVDKGVGSLINEGDDVLVSYSEEVHATVVSVREEERKEYFFNNFTGKYVSGKVADKSDVYIELTCDAKVSDTAITTESDLDIRVGDQMSVRKKGCVVSGYIVEVQVDGE